jgi:hypothetical protein
MDTQLLLSLNAALVKQYGELPTAQMVKTVGNVIEDDFILWGHHTRHQCCLCNQMVKVMNWCYTITWSDGSAQKYEIMVHPQCFDHLVADVAHAHYEATEAAHEAAREDAMLLILCVKQTLPPVPKDLLNLLAAYLGV